LKRFALLIPAVFLLSLFFPRCAVIVAPVGGAKDTIPPVLVKSDPARYATNFNRNKILLTFNEYIKLEKINEKLVLSPPQEQLPGFKIKGKGIEMKFSEPLMDSTTYTLYFADAILDNNESNKLNNFEFAFSTGPVIDSLRFSGKVIDAYNKKPKEAVFVMLYDKLYDSIPIKERPKYVTKTDKDGVFFLSNVKHSRYKIFALADGNSNYKFDQVSEAIAFSTSFIDTSMLLPPSKSRVNKDSLLTLNMFLEENRVLSLTDYSRKQRRRLNIGFTRKPEGEVKITPLNVSIDSTESWFIKGTSVRGDSLDLWIVKNSISKIDTLLVLASYLKTDSLLNLVQTNDTLRMFFLERTRPSLRQSKRVQEEAEKKPTLSILSSLKNGSDIIPNKPITLTFGMPLLQTDTSRIEIFNVTDSVKLPFVSLKIDSLNPRKYSITHSWKEKVKYNLNAFPGAFTNLDSIANDSLMISFKGADPEQYGSINMNITGVQPNIIVELLNEKMEVVDSKIVQKDDLFTFTYVKPGKYYIRFIVDQNRNGKWDTGWYFKGVQPENVILYKDNNNSDEIQVRANWEYDLSFNLKQSEDVSSNELRNVPNEEKREREPIRNPSGSER
jgi:hypothetical protein